MAKKRNAGSAGAKSKGAARDLPVRSTGKVKGGADLGSMADMASSSQFQLQQATTQASQATSAQSNTAKKTSDTQNAIIRNLRG